MAVGKPGLYPSWWHYAAVVALGLATGGGATFLAWVVIHALAR
ncbi:MAG: hypothetical protein ACLQJR_34005 [Stellaceae bacterium]